MAAENRVVPLAVTVTDIWKSGTTYLPSLKMTDTTIIRSWFRKILIPEWD